MSDLQSKTDEELNVMLAELAGWTNITKNHRGLIGTVPPERGFHFEKLKFCSSLDEVAKAEAGLTDEHQVSYAKTLWDSVGPTSDFKGSKGFWHVGFKHATAAARQRTIALIETLQKP